MVENVSYGIRTGVMVGLLCGKVGVRKEGGWGWHVFGYNIIGGVGRNGTFGENWRGGTKRGLSGR